MLQGGYSSLGGKQPKGFRKSLKLVRFTRPSPSQESTNSKDCAERYFEPNELLRRGSDQLSCLEETDEAQAN